MAPENLQTNEIEESKNGVQFCVFTSCKIFFVFIGFVAVGFVAGYFVYFILDAVKDQESLRCVNSHSGLEICDNVSGSFGSPKKAKETSFEKYANVRLPRSIKPLHYHIKLVPFVNGNFSIHGYTAMTFEVVEKTSNITLHINGIITHNDTVKLVLADDNDGTEITIWKHTFDAKRQFYIAFLKAELQAGTKYKISMDFTGSLNDNMNGFYRSSYTDSSGNIRWIAGTQFQPTDARKAFPCLDEPGLKANFTVELARQNHMSSLSNMALKNSMPMEGRTGWMWDKFETTFPMSTYTVAFIVSDFDFKESVDENAYDFKVWARVSAINLTDHALRIGPLVSKIFEDYLEVPYPLPKQDMIALPEFAAGAMENWGLITYRETSLLLDPTKSSAHEKQSITKTIVHEIAHQWFGNLVTPLWWTGLWLNEGFAGYMEYVGLHRIEPTFKADNQFVIDKIHAAFSLDCLESSHAIYMEVEDPNQSNGPIQYLKGASLLRMMNYFLGENTFRRGISEYLRGRSFSSVEQDDLWHYLSEQAFLDGTLANSVTVKAIMDTWTLQKGFPMITVTKNNDGTALLKQERFTNGASDNSTDEHDYKWWIPITFATQSNPDFTTTKPKEWMQPTETTTIIKGVPNSEWVIFNVQQAGFYRVNYDQENWESIIRQLNHDHTLIHPINRAQIIDDSVSLAKSGILSYKTVMRVLSYLKNEEEFVPWNAALSGINYLDDMFAQSGGYGALKDFILSLMAPLYDKIGFSDRLTDPHLDQLKRASILSKICHLGYQPCEQEALTLFNKWMQNPGNFSLISPNLKSAVYCTGIKTGGYREWNFMWQKLLTSTDASERKLLMNSLGCTKEHWILNGYLERAVSEGSGILKQDIRLVVAAVAKNKQGKLISWEFIKDNFQNKILKIFGDSVFNFSGIVKAVTESLNTRNHLKELKNFKSDHQGKFGSAELAIQQSIEKVTNNVHWMNAHYLTILQWLSNNGYKTAV